MDKYEKEILDKIDAGVKFTERELSNLIDYEIDREEGDRRRWTCSVGSVLEIGGRHFMLNWECGLTECQENEFYDQPYEVEKRTYEKVVTVTEWVEVQKK